MILPYLFKGFVKLEVADNQKDLCIVSYIVAPNWSKALEYLLEKVDAPGAGGEIKSIDLVKYQEPLIGDITHG